jgi:hypothetical protein
MTSDDAKAKYDVFISYAREDDKTFVERLCQDLEVAGKKVWWDKTAMESRGRSFLVEIRDAIWDSERLIAVIGPKALQSTYVRQEWAYAYNFSKAVVPILRYGTYESISEESAQILWRDEFERLPDRFDASQLKTLHCPDFTDDATYQDAFDELLRVLNADLLPLAPVLGEAPPFPPPNFLPRRRAIKKLAKLGLVDPKDLRAIQPEQRIMVIHGPGGSGKSVAANAIAHAFQTRRAFEDGIVWLKIGKPRKEEGMVTERFHVWSALKAVGTSFKQDTKGYDDMRIAKQLVKELLADKRCLLILDDVWDSGDVQDFLEVFGPGCAIDITTRKRAIADELSVPYVSLGDEDLELDDEEARQLLADWAGQGLETLPPEAEEVASICGRLPLALAICGAVIRSGLPWRDLPAALLAAMERVVEAEIPSYQKEEISVFAPISVSLDYLKQLDEKDKRAGKEPIDRYDQYLDLSALPAGEKTPDDVIKALWIARRGTNEISAHRLLTRLNAWALLRQLEEHPYAYILLHRLQTVYLQKRIDEKEREPLHRAFGQALFDTWQTGRLVRGRPLDEREQNQEEEYCRRFLFMHLAEGRCWPELQRLLGDVKYLTNMREDPESQRMLEAEIAGLLRNRDAPVKELLAGAWEGITKKMLLGRAQADWLDTFAYWINKYGHDGERWQSEQLKTAARQFDDACGHVSEQLMQKYLKENKQDYALRYAELSAWAYQRAGDFESCATACEEAERSCAEEGMEKGYQTLGRAEFVRMRAHALSVLAEMGTDLRTKETRRAQANEAYQKLASDFSRVGSQNWLLSKEEWQRLEEDTPAGFDLGQRKRVDASCSFKAVVVSNAHDALSAMYVIQFLENKGGLIDWLHHNQFTADHPALTGSALVVLIGGPKTPGISEVAEQFYNADSEGYLRMYSGLHFGPSTLKTTIAGTPYFMLGGISKAHTLLAAYNFTDREDLDEFIRKL